MNKLLPAVFRTVLGKMDMTAAAFAESCGVSVSSIQHLADTTENTVGKYTFGQILAVVPKQLQAELCKAWAYDNMPESAHSSVHIISVDQDDPEWLIQDEAFPDRRRIWDELTDRQRRVMIRLGLQFKNGAKNEDLLASLRSHLGE